MDREPLMEVLEELRHRGAALGAIKRSGEKHLGFSCIFAPWKHEGGHDHNPSMTASVDTQGPSMLKCHCCGHVGTLEDSLNKLNQLENGTITDLVHLVRRIDETRMLRVKSKPERYRPKNYTSALKKFLVDIPEIGSDFLTKKGCSGETVMRMKVGWIDNAWFTSPSGYDYEVRNALIFPVISMIGRRRICVGAQAREVSRDKRRQKYFTVFSFDAYRHFFGEQFVGEMAGKRLFLVEGPLDCMHLMDLGLNALGLMGVYLSNARAIKIQQANPRKVYVMLDPDKAGTEGSEGVLKRLEAYDIPSEEIKLTKDPKLLTHNDIKNLFPIQD